MDKVQLIAIAVGILIPMLISFLKQKNLPRWANALIAAAVCFAAGVVTAAANGQLVWTSARLWGTIGIIFGFAQATYAAYWSGSGLEDILAPIFSLFKDQTET